MIRRMEYIVIMLVKENLINQRIQVIIIMENTLQLERFSVCLIHLSINSQKIHVKYIMLKHIDMQITINQEAQEKSITDQEAQEKSITEQEIDIVNTTIKSEKYNTYIKK